MNNTDSAPTIEPEYMVPAGTPVRDIYGQPATLDVDWFIWEARVTIVSASGYRSQNHPGKVFTLDGQPLPYQP